VFYGGRNCVESAPHLTDAVIQIAELIGGSSMRGCTYSTGGPQLQWESTALAINTAFVPPNANEFDITLRTDIP